MDVAAAAAAYYGNPAVRARIAEYCAGSAGLAGYGGSRRRQASDMAPVAVGATGLPALLTEGADVCRSLSDRRGAILQLDVDYVNVLDPAEPYRDAAACFRRMEPVFAAVRDAFAEAGVPTLDLMTGRGYHFTARARAGSPLHRELMTIGAGGAASGTEAGVREAAHAGAGRLVEALAHEVARQVQIEIPVTLADVPPPGRGPFMCLDLSAYGDPVSSRYARSAFSSHQKSAMTGLIGGPPFTIAIPRRDEALATLLAIRADPAAAADLAADAGAAIPDVTDAPRWVRSYADGVLARFHRAFDDERGARDPKAAADAYARMDPAQLPVCVRQALERPNPGLLVPTALRAVAFVLWGRGWHPRQVADLIRSRYEADHGWGDLWMRYDPASRADFYVRLFAGTVLTGLDGPENFSCLAQQLRGACPGGECGHELARLFPVLRTAASLGLAP